MNRLFQPFSPKPVGSPVASSAGLAELAELALDMLPCATLVVNANGTIVYASKPVTQVLGWSISDLQGIAVTQLFTPADQRKLATMLFLQGAASLQDAAAKEIDIQVFGKNQHLKKAMISVAHFCMAGPDPCLYVTARCLD